MLKHLLLVLSFALSAAFAVAQDYGVVVGDKVRVRSKGNISGTIITELEMGTVVKILDATGEYVYADKSTGDACDKAMWVKVSLASGEQGYIFGNFLYGFDSQEPHLSFSMDGAAYKLCMASNFSNGMIQEEDYTIPCGGSDVPLVVNMAKSMPEVFLIHNKNTYRSNETTGKNAEMQSLKDKYWQLDQTEGYMQNVDKEPVMLDGKLLLDMDTYNADEGTSLTVVEIAKDSYGRFVAKAISFQKTDD